MARSKRIDFPGARHHVMNRAVDNRPLFQDEDACGIFLEILSELPQRFGVVVQGYALVSGDFHLMLQTPRGNLSQAMSFLLSTFTRRFNSTRSAGGPLFEGRFLSRPVLEETSWRRLSMQLHIEPVRAGLSDRAEDFSWSSHRYFSGASQVPPWLKVAPVLSGFPSIDAYNEAMGTLNGSVFNIDELFHSAESSVPVQLYPQLRLSAEELSDREPSDEAVAELVDRIERVTGASLEELRSARRGRRGNAPRVMAAYWLIYRGGLTNGETAQWLQMSPASVSQALARVRTREPGGELDAYLHLLMTDEYDHPLNQKM